MEKIFKKSYKNNKFKILVRKCNDKLELPDKSYSILDIQDYFQYISKKLAEKTDNPSKRIYVNKIENRITFTKKAEYCLELLMLETMKLLRSTKSKTTKMKMMKMCLASKLLKSIIILLTMIINIIQEFCIHLFPINRLVNG